MNKDFLRKRRIEIGLSQESIANVLGYSIQTISLWESGKASPNLMVWSKYASLLQIDLEGLILDKDKKDNNYSDDLAFDANKFANELRRLRKNKGLTQIDLSKKLNINVGLIIKFEKGKSFPNIKQFIALCVYYKLSFDELYFSISVNKTTEKEPKKKKIVPLPVLIPIIIAVAGGTTATSVVLISKEVAARRNIKSNTVEEVAEEQNENNDPINNDAPENNDQVIDNPIIDDPNDDENNNQNHQDLVLNDDELTFGSYPQSRVTDVSLISTLESLSINENGYYEYEENLYEKCQAHYQIPHENDAYFINGDKVIENEYYWFKVEPIVWTIIKEEDDNYLVISKDIIDAYKFDDAEESELSNNYKDSDLRSFLNNKFLNKAFDSYINQLIEVEVDNSISCTGDDVNHYVSENTNDYAYTPSIIELEQFVGTSLPFTYPLPENVTRDLKSMASEYSLIKDLYVDNYGYGCYWLRAPDNSRTNEAKSINSKGKYFVTQKVNRELGIRPIIKIHK